MEECIRSKKRRQVVRKRVGPDFLFHVVNNPRPLDGGMGKEKCDICCSRPSVLLEFGTSNEWDNVVFCKSCLDKMIKLIDWGILQQARKGRRNV